MKTLTVQFTVTTSRRHTAAVDVPDNCDPTTPKGRANIADALRDQYPDLDDTADDSQAEPVQCVTLPGGPALPWDPPSDASAYSYPDTERTGAQGLAETADRATRHGRRHP